MRSHKQVALIDRDLDRCECRTCSSAFYAGAQVGMPDRRCDALPCNVAGQVQHLFGGWIRVDEARRGTYLDDALCDRLQDRKKAPLRFRRSVRTQRGILRELADG